MQYVLCIFVSVLISTIIMACVVNLAIDGVLKVVKERMYEGYID